MLAGYAHNVTPVTVTAGSATSGTSIYPVMVAPYGGMTVKAAYVAATSAVAANSSNYVTLNLLDQGAAGTALTSIGTAAGTAGVTTSAIDQPFTLSTNNLDAGDVLGVKLGKIGSITEREFAVIIEWVHGQG